jgi:hypothetical protein
MQLETTAALLEYCGAKGLDDSIPSQEDWLAVPVLDEAECYG